MVDDNWTQIAETDAWAEINPTTALAPRPAPQSPSLGRLQPASSDDFRNELTACLALVVPVGMTEEARREWLTVAWGTLKHLPADLLKMGCAEARRVCDHPSKIVPTIIAETEEMMRARRSSASEDRTPQLAAPKPLLDRRGEPMSETETDQLNKILTGLGATARYRTDGSRYFVDETTTGAN